MITPAPTFGKKQEVQPSIIGKHTQAVPRHVTRSIFVVRYKDRVAAVMDYTAVFV